MPQLRATLAVVAMSACAPASAPEAGPMDDDGAVPAPPLDTPSAADATDPPVDTAPPAADTDSGAPIDPWVSLGTYVACAGARNRRMQCWGGYNQDVSAGFYVSEAPSVLTGHPARLDSLLLLYVVDVDGVRHGWPTYQASTFAPHQALAAEGLVSLDSGASKIRGGSLLCVLTADGATACTEEIEVSVPRVADPARVYTDGTSVCVQQADGLLTCAGASLDALDGVRAAHVSVRALTACVVDTDGVASCLQGIPDEVDPTGVRRIGASYLMGCVIRRAGDTLDCWGDPKLVRRRPASGGWADVHVLRDVACAVSFSGDIACWGSDRGHLISEAPASL